MDREAWQRILGRVPSLPREVPADPRLPWMALTLGLLLLLVTLAMCARDPAEEILVSPAENLNQEEPVRGRSRRGGPVEIAGVEVGDPRTSPTVTTIPDAYPPPPATPTPRPYPGVTVPPTRPPYPGPTETSLPAATATQLPGPTVGPWLFLPLLPGPPLPLPTPTPSQTPTPTNTPPPTDTPTPSPTPTPTIDFRAVRAELNARGSELGFSKIGFHVGVAGNRTGLGEWMQRLDAAGVPFFLKSADDAGPLFEAQAIARNSDVPHTLVFRRSGDEYDTPDYSLSPAEAAQQHWQLHMAAWPPELDPSLVWIETINEVDKNRSVWLADFALATAQLAIADGFRWAAFGWSSGEPEISDWESPAMLRFLRFASEHPDRIAIALHEYSYMVSDIGDQYPYKVGRFQLLYQVCDRHGIPRPTVLITEWGWEYQNVPLEGEAIEDIAWAAELYAPYPQVRGAAIWYLGGFFGEIHDQTQSLIKPVTEFSLGNYYAIPMPPAQAPINPSAHAPP